MRRLSFTRHEELPGDANAGFGRELNIKRIGVAAGPSAFFRLPDFERDFVLRKTTEDLILHFAQQLFAAGVPRLKRLPGLQLCRFDKSLLQLGVERVLGSSCEHRKLLPGFARDIAFLEWRRIVLDPAID